MSKKEGNKEMNERCVPYRYLCGSHTHWYKDRQQRCYLQIGHNFNGDSNWSRPIAIFFIVAVKNSEELAGNVQERPQLP